MIRSARINLISEKKFFENRLSDSIGKPKELWKALNSLGLPSKTSVCRTPALKLLDVFKNYYSTLAEILFQKLSTTPIKYTFTSVIQYSNILFKLMLYI